MGMSSNPATASSSGTETPSSRSAERAPMAIASFAAKTTVVQCLAISAQTLGRVMIALRPTNDRDSSMALLQHMVHHLVRPPVIVNRQHASVAGRHRRIDEYDRRTVAPLREHLRELPIGGHEDEAIDPAIHGAERPVHL